jgi:hypothetical protein
MNKFFVDTWNELRSRRLWPVALVLVAALVAVPVLLRKSPESSSSSSSSAPTPSTSSPATDAKPVVVATSDTTVGGSKLNMFKSKDPFKPHLPKVKAASAGTTGPSTSSNSSSSGSQSGGSGSGSGGSTGGTGSSPTQPAGPFAYVVDLKFGKRDATKTHHNVQKLDVLPDANNPLIVFMGVNTAGDTAVFLTDTSLKASGEGTCKPSPDVCSFLYLKLDKQDDTEDLLAQNPDGTGIEYTLKLLDIKKVPVSELAKASKSAKSSKRAATAVGDKRGKAATPFHWPFDLPQLPDEVNG